MNPKVKSASPAAGRTQRASQAGFTVTELMVAVSLMSLIVFALYAMFNQVQKALRANMSQVDSSERGRAVLEIVSRELEAARVSMRPEVTNFWIMPQARALQPGVQTDIMQIGIPNTRTNMFEYIYYQAKQDKAWRGVGFLVLDPTNNPAGKQMVGPAANGLGKLYRYETPEPAREFYHPTTNLFHNYLTNLDMVNLGLAPATNFAHVADGVVHFKLLPYDTQGRLLAFSTTNLDSAYRIIRQFSANPKTGLPFKDSSGMYGSYCEVVTTNTLAAANVFLVSMDSLVARPFQTQAMAAFRSNALPAYVELELGVLEPDAMKRYDQMVKDGQAVAAKAYLQKRIANVQIFRKRIPFRTVVP